MLESLRKGEVVYGNHVWPLSGQKLPLSYSSLPDERCCSDGCSLPNSSRTDHVAYSCPRKCRLLLLSCSLILALSGCSSKIEMANQNAATNSGQPDSVETAALSGFSCSHTTMTGSGTDACTVTVDAPAASGGLIVNLSTNNAALTVPASVTVPADATSAGFSATVSPVAASQTVTLTASAGSVSESFAVQLNAAAPTLSVATSGSPSSYGGAVTLTATISNGLTGPVTFYDGGVSIGTGVLNGTTATLTTALLTAGTHTITANWPGNSNYEAVTSAAITQLVSAATPAISWTAPAAIAYGTALSATQLDATSSVAGTFSYSPAAGTVLKAGSQTLSVTFTPTDSTDYTTATQSVLLTVNAGASMLSINASSVGFGNVGLNTLTTQTVTLTSTGTASVTVNSATVTGTGFSLAGSTFSATLTPGQTATLGVQFDPTAAGAVTGSLTITSTSSTSGTVVIPLTGTGTTSPYAVDLTWDAPTSSTDPIAGYNVYRAPSGSSMYQLLNSSIDTQTTYTDSTVQSGQSYNYIVESVDDSGVESAPTSPIAVTIPGA